MADIRKIAGSIARDGECGEGEGKRGKRGHRGETGATGATGATGPGGPPFWPPFASTLTIIYVRTTGSDTDGDGETIETAYRTIQRAVRDVPGDIPPGERFLVDATGLGLISEGGGEVLPPNYALPPVSASFGVEFAYTLPPDQAAAYYPFNTVTAAEIIAKPRPAVSVPPADQVITAGDLVGPGITFDPDTNLVEIHTSKSYPVDSLKDKLIQDSVALRGRIWHNTNVAPGHDVIYLTIAQTQDEFLTPVFSSAPTGFPPGFPQGFPVAPPLLIVEPSSELQTQKSPTNVIQGGLTLGDRNDTGIRGFKIQLAPAFTNPTAFNVEAWGCRSVFFEACELDGFAAAHEGGPIGFIFTLIHDALFVNEYGINCFGSAFRNVTFGAPWENAASFTGIGFVMEGCTAFGPRLDAILPAGRGPSFDVLLRSGVIRNSIPDLNLAQIADPADFPAPFVPFSLNPALATPGHGILVRTGHAFLDHVKIFGCAGDGIHAEAGNAFVEIKSVTGGQGGLVFTDLPDTPNGGVGVLITDGTICRVSDQDPVPNPVVTNVFGVSGDAHVGDTPGLNPTWLAIEGGTQAYDNVGPTATGSRLYAKP